MAIYKRTDGYGWRLDVTHTYPDGEKERVRQTFPTKREADARSRQIGAELDDAYRKRKLGLHRAPAPTLREFHEPFVAFLENEHRDGFLKRSTIETYESALKQQLLPFFGDYALDQIGPAEVEEFKTARPKLAAKTLKNHIGVLSKVLDVALQLKKIDQRPSFKTRRARSGGTDAQQYEYWDFDETERVLAHVDSEPRIANIMRLALATGLRLGECCGLLWGDIDLEKRVLTVRRQYSRKRVTTPKSNRLRTVPLSDAAVEALALQKPRTFLRSHGGDAADDHGNPNLSADWVFVDESGLFSFNRIKDGLARVVKKAGVRRLTFHGLRHTFASHAAMNSVPIEVLQRWLGHSEITVTMKYAHLCPDHTHQFIEKMNQNTLCPERAPRGKSR